MPPISPRKITAAAGVAWLLLALAGCTPARDVLPVYLTWSDEDTSTTMTVQYHTLGAYDGTHVYYDTAPRSDEIGRYASHAQGFERTLPGVDRVVHVVPLTGLAPGTRYWFVAGDAKSGFREERSFRTLPADDSPVKFVAGGDMSTGWLSRLASWWAARTDPSFVLIGGDLAYGRGSPKNYPRWQQWFADWEATMRAPDGRLIPLVAAIGNHDRRWKRETGDGDDPAPYFHGFFYQDPAERSYFVRRFGPRVVLFVLDTGHLATVIDAQRDWLATELRAKAEVPERFALYHVALFPAAQPVNSDVMAIRAAWLPLFDKFGLTAAFENHGHLQKRTWPLRLGVPVANGRGTVFFGDGAWGKSKTKTPKLDRAYLAAAFSRRHFWKVSVSGQGASYEAIDGFGRVFDRTAQDLSGAWIPE